MMSKLGGEHQVTLENQHQELKIKDNGQASGAVHLMKLFESMADVVVKAVEEVVSYLPIDHPTL